MSTAFLTSLYAPAIGCECEQALIASAEDRLRPQGPFKCSEQDSNLHWRDSRSRASAEVGLPEHSWIPEGLEPSSPGCKPSVFPVGRRTHTRVLREGFEPSASAFGGPRSSDRVVATSPARLSVARHSGPSRIRTCTNLILSQAPLPNWATGPRVLIHSPSSTRCTERDSNPHPSG